MVFEAEKVISDQPADMMVQSLGEMLHKSWDLKKSLSSRITNAHIDLAYEKAMAAGAYGGKLAGAGGGGFLFFLAPFEKHAAIREALSKMLEVEFSFENEGSKIIYLKH